MGVTCEILINKSREGGHIAGAAVTGLIKYTVYKPTEYKNVTLSFIGRGKCKWYNDENYTGTEKYIHRHVNITNKTPDETITLHGDYVYPFEFYLPEDIPTTFKLKRDDKTSWISYALTLKFVQSKLLSFNKVFSTEIPAYGTVDSLNNDGESTVEGPVTFGLEKNILCPISTKKPLISIKAVIANTRLTPGENAHISCTVSNRSNVLVKGVTAELFYYITYTSDCGKTDKHNKKVKNCGAEMPEVNVGAIRYHTCVVPTLPDCYSIQHSKIISKEYRIRVTLRLSVPYMNAFVEIPVAIGERKRVADSCKETQTKKEKEEPPPSFWEVMSEDKISDWYVVTSEKVP